MAAASASEVVKLGKVYRSLKDGMAKPEQFFTTGAAETVNGKLSDPSPAAAEGAKEPKVEVVPAAAQTTKAPKADLEQLQRLDAHLYRTKWDGLYAHLMRLYKVRQPKDLSSEQIEELVVFVRGLPAAEGRG